MCNEEQLPVKNRFVGVMKYLCCSRTNFHAMMEALLPMIAEWVVLWLFPAGRFFFFFFFFFFERTYVFCVFCFVSCFLAFFQGWNLPKREHIKRCYFFDSCCLWAVTASQYCLCQSSHYISHKLNFYYPGQWKKI